MRKLSGFLAALTAAAVLTCSLPVHAASQAFGDEEYFVSSKTSFSLDLPTDRVVRVACVGDSITQGSDNRLYPAYPSYLQDLLGDGFDVRNFGVSGATLMFSDNISNAYTRTDQYPLSLEFQPDVVIIMLGTNDSAAYAYKRFDEYFDSDYAALVDSYKSLDSHPYVIVATSPYVARPDSDTAVRVNTRIVSHQMKLFDSMDTIDGVVDIYSFSKDRYYLYNDGVHYTPMGYYTLAMEFYRCIFGMGLNTLTVNTTPGAVVEFDRQVTGANPYTYSAVADEDGKALCYGPDGSYNITIRADGYEKFTGSAEISGGDKSMDASLTPGDYNVALYRPVTASTELSELSPVTNVNDEDHNSNWSPTEADGNGQCWITVDLGDEKEIHGVRLQWDLAFGSDYKVQVSNDNENWTDAAVITGSSGGTIDEHYFDSVRGRYVKVTFTRKGTALGWNYSLYDLQVLSDDQRTVSQRELDAIAQAEQEQEQAQTPAGEKNSALPWIIADVVIAVIGAAAVILTAVKRKRS